MIHVDGWEIADFESKFNFKALSLSHQFEIKKTAPTIVHSTFFILLIVSIIFLFPVIPSALLVEPPPTYNDNISPECSNFTHGNWEAMEFYSPGYPDKYPNKIDCVMYLQGELHCLHISDATCTLCTMILDGCRLLSPSVSHWMILTDTGNLKGSAWFVKTVIEWHRSTRTS